jgi:hypothetical protein
LLFSRRETINPTTSAMTKANTSDSGDKPTKAPANLPQPSCTRQVKPPVHPRSASPEDAEHEAWLAKYEPVERAIIEAREKRLERRLEARFRRKYERARRFGDICEMSDGAAARWRRDGFFEGEELWLALTGDCAYFEYMDYIGKSATRDIDRMRGLLRRPLYYAAENERRRALAAERRKIRRRHTVNACPTREAVLEAWENRKSSHEAAMRFGSLLEDLECYIDNSLRRNEEGVIVGRNGGIKSWLRENVPALALVYSSVMRYKAAAKKLRQIAGLADPTPAEVVLEAKCDYGADETAAGGDVTDNAGQSGAEKATTGGEGADPKAVGAATGAAGVMVSGAEKGRKVPDVAVVRAKAIWEEVRKTAGDSVTALFERLDA